MPKILGRARLHAQLLALPPAIKAGMRDALVQGATQVSNEQKSLLGNDPKLKEATGWTFGRPGSRPSGVLGSGGPVPDDLRITIYSGSKEAFWARWREFGTHPHSLAKGASRKRSKLQDKGPHNPGERASPYFFPVWRANKKAVKKMITKAVNAAMKKVAQQ